MNWLRKLFKRPPRYVYGRVERPDGHKTNPVRLDLNTGRVQFILWPAGQQGHSVDYWHDMGYGWENWFIPNNVDP